MESTLKTISVYLRTRQPNWEGKYIWAQIDPNDLMLESIAEQLLKKPDATHVTIHCPNLFSDPSEYSYSWYIKYAHLTFEFEGPRAGQFDNAAKAAKTRQGEWF